MAITIHLDIVSAQASIYSGSVNEVYATASEGEVGLLHGHAQLLTTLKPGNVRAVLPNGEQEVFYISGGILEVQPEVITILADTAVRAEDLDEAEALEAKRRAEQAIKEKTSKIEYTKAISALAEAAAQLEAIRKLRKKIAT